MGGGGGLNNESTNNFIIASYSDLTFDDYTNNTKKYDDENRNILNTLLENEVETLTSLGAIEGSTVILTEVITENNYTEEEFISLITIKLNDLNVGQKKTLFVKSDNAIYRLSGIKKDEAKEISILEGFLSAFYGGNTAPQITIYTSNEEIMSGFTGYISNVDDTIRISKSDNTYDKEFRESIVNDKSRVNNIDRITISYDNQPSSTDNNQSSSTGSLTIKSEAFTNDALIYGSNLTENNEWKMTNIMIIPDLDPNNKRDLYIKQYAFSNNSSLKKFEIVPDFKSIDLAGGSMGGGNVFSNCTDLEDVTIGKSNEGITLGESTFMNCTKLKTLIIDSKINTTTTTNHIPMSTLCSVNGFNDNKKQSPKTAWNENDNDESLFLVSLEQTELSFGSDNGIFSDKSTNNDELELEKGEYRPKRQIGNTIYHAIWTPEKQPWTHKRVVIKNNN